MDTYEIASHLKMTASLMELHGQNPFKVKSLSNAAFKLNKTGIALEGLSLEALEKIEGIGKGIALKIYELQTTGTLKELKELMVITPAGVIQMLAVKGIGPKKVAQLWKELGVESPGELLYACHENRLVDLKGFGSKTQDQVRKAIEFNLASAGKVHYASLEEFALSLVKTLKQDLKTDLISLTGPMRRKCEIIEQVDILVGTDRSLAMGDHAGKSPIPINIITCSTSEFHKKLFETSSSAEHISLLSSCVLPVTATSEEEIYRAAGLQYIEPELREGLKEVELAKQHKLGKFIEVSDLKGILHNHTTYSDGLHTLREMAEYCKELGYEYLGICDHSQSAFYANGLKPDRVIQQQKEIDQLNKDLYPFKIFKGIESDILSNGLLDYEDEILHTFDFVVASIHSNLKMDKERATTRLIKAIENPYTTILGHPTGRLLLSREGYPIDHQKVIDACAANNVIIELNSHPYRLDIDWRWIPYCMEKGVKISINPDAHEKQGYHDMHYGVCVARKGMLTREMCFNSLTLDEIATYFINKKQAL